MQQQLVPKGSKHHGHRGASDTSKNDQTQYLRVLNQMEKRLVRNDIAGALNLGLSQLEELAPTKEGNAPHSIQWWKLLSLVVQAKLMGLPSPSSSTIKINSITAPEDVVKFLPSICDKHFLGFFPPAAVLLQAQVFKYIGQSQQGAMVLEDQLSEHFASQSTKKSPRGTPRNGSSTSPSTTTNNRISPSTALYGKWTATMLQAALRLYFQLCFDTQKQKYLYTWRHAKTVSNDVAQQQQDIEVCLKEAEDRCVNFLSVNAVMITEVVNGGEVTQRGGTENIGANGGPSPTSYEDFMDLVAQEQKIALKMLASEAKKVSIIHRDQNTNGAATKSNGTANGTASKAGGSRQKVDTSSSSSLIKKINENTTEVSPAAVRGGFMQSVRQWLMQMLQTLRDMLMSQKGTTGQRISWTAVTISLLSTMLLLVYWMRRSRGFRGQNAISSGRAQKPKLVL